MQPFCRGCNLLAATHSNDCTTVYGEVATVGLKVFRVSVTALNKTQQSSTIHRIMCKVNVSPAKCTESSKALFVLLNQKREAYAAVCESQQCLNMKNHVYMDTPVLIKD